MCAFDFDFVLTGMENELGLRQQILRLQDYRNNGISHPLSAAFYSKLKSQREQDLIDRPKETILDYIRSAKTKAGIIKANPLMTMTTRRYVCRLFYKKKTREIKQLNQFHEIFEIQKMEIYIFRKNYMKLNLFDILFNEFLAWTCFSIKFNEI